MYLKTCLKFTEKDFESSSYVFFLLSWGILLDHIEEVARKYSLKKMFLLFRA